jgi:hypothetical protein
VVIRGEIVLQLGNGFFREKEIEKGDGTSIIKTTLNIQCLPDKERNSGTIDNYLTESCICWGKNSANKSGLGKCDIRK